MTQKLSVPVVGCHVVEMIETWLRPHLRDMGWWPFSSSTPSKAVPTKDAPIETIVNTVKPTQAPEKEPSATASDAATSSGSIVEKELPLEQRNPYRNLESHRDSRIQRSWQSYQEQLRPIVWPHGVSEWPVFGLSGLFLATTAIPGSILPGLPPRLARVIFSGAFATSGMAIREGDEWNGASIATWWSASHVLLSSLYKTYRKEMTKKGVKTLPTKSSPFAWALTTATIATGAAYGITL